MKYGVIKDQTAKIEDHNALLDAVMASGLDPASVDHGSLTREMAIVVGEFSLMHGGENPKFWSIGRQLSQGPGVIYQVDENGETIDLVQLPPILFYRDAEQVNKALEHNHIDRPFRAVTSFSGGEVDTEIQWVFGRDNDE
jgi:hypothetical protein